MEKGKALIVKSSAFLLTIPFLSPFVLMFSHIVLSRCCYFQYGLLSTEFRLQFSSFRYHITASIHGDLRD